MARPFSYHCEARAENVFCARRSDKKTVWPRETSSTAKTQSPEQSIVGHETQEQWTQLWSRVRSQVDVIHLVRSTGAIVSNPHLHSVKSCPEKSRPIKYGGQVHSVMIAIEYSYKLDRENYFNLWCELGRLLLRQSHSYIISFTSLALEDIYYLAIS